MYGQTAGEWFSRLDTEFYLRFLESVRIPQRTAFPGFSCIANPKKQDMLLYVHHCRTEYLTVDGQKIETEDGFVVYVPTGSEYRVRCTESTADGATFQINFRLYDAHFTPFTLSSGIAVFTPHDATLAALFEKQMRLGEDAATHFTAHKSVLYEILNTLSAEIFSHGGNAPAHGNSHDGTPAQEKGKLSVIEPGVAYLYAHYAENPSVEMLAEICHISPEYFRRLFRAQTGVSPVACKNALRLKRAEQYLLYGDMSVREIAAALSFATEAHFVRQFREKYGLPPLAYRHSGGGGQKNVN